MEIASVAKQCLHLPETHARREIPCLILTEWPGTGDCIVLKPWVKPNTSGKTNTKTKIHELIPDDILL